MSDTKKLLRMGSDAPRCGKCGSEDRRLLCRAKQDTCTVIRCRNCRALRKPLAPKAAAQKAQRFQDEGYYEPACVICEHPVLQVLELDHVANAANSDLVAPLCANHHAIKSYLAESGPMTALRFRDPRRSALAFEAAFDFGLAAIFGTMAAVDRSENMARAVFCGLIAAALVVWGVWSLSADDYFERVLGRDTTARSQRGCRDETAATFSTAE
jgi:hypothetical protein